MRDAVSLFVDGLPLEMSWDWLQQIFRGEGNIIDVYGSKKKRSRRDCRFVRFRKLEEAKMAVRNLNGVMIREKIMKASFAKYDKNGRPWTDSFMQEEENESKAVGRAVKIIKATNGGRSFKEVVEGLSRNIEKDDWAKDNHRSIEGFGVGMNRNETEMMNLKEMTWRLVDEIFKAASREEVIRNIGSVFVEMISELKKKVVLADLGDCRNTGEKEEDEPRVAEEEEQLGVLLEEELVISMLHKDQQAPMPLIGSFFFFFFFGHNNSFQLMTQLKWENKKQPSFRQPTITYRLRT